MKPFASISVSDSVELVPSSYSGHSLSILICPAVDVPLNTTSAGIGDTCDSVLVTTEDRMIPPDAERAMSKRAGSQVVEVKGSHAVYVSQPHAVASIIESAAEGCGVGDETIEPG